MPLSPSQIQTLQGGIAYQILCDRMSFCRCVRTYEEGRDWVSWLQDQGCTATVTRVWGENRVSASWNRALLDQWVHLPNVWGPSLGVAPPPPPRDTPLRVWQYVLYRMVNPSLSSATGDAYYTEFSLRERPLAEGLRDAARAAGHQGVIGTRLVLYGEGDEVPILTLRVHWSRSLAQAG